MAMPRDDERTWWFM